MLKLYYSPGACAVASHIGLEEAGADYAIEKIDLRAGQQRTPAGQGAHRARMPGTAPGPGSYEVGRHLSRSVLSHSRSTGSATLLSRVKMWKTDNYPGPASYFK
jgi:hypothetical protein